MKEIGGYLDFELRNNGSIYYDKLISLNTVRNAIEYIIKAKHYKKIYLPIFLGDSIKKKVKRMNLDFEYYHINEKFYPILKDNIRNDEVILIVNYYGQIEDSYILKYKEKWNNIILDNTQSFFTPPLIISGGGGE